MALTILKLVRFAVPAILMLIFAKLLGFLIGWWNMTLPDFEKSPYLPIILIPGALYYITPLRGWINAPHHSRITEHLRTGLVQIAGYPDKPEKYTWKKLRPLFFSLIDQDESLKQKATLAYSNGAIWTSFADATALALIFSLTSGVLYSFGVGGASVAGVIFLLVAAVSFLGSLACTSKQIGIGAEQLEIMDFKYKSDVEKRLNALDG